LNWYANRNVRFMLDYLYGNITKQLSPTNPADVGAKFDAVAMPLRSLSDRLMQVAENLNGIRR